MNVSVRDSGRQNVTVRKHPLGNPPVPLSLSFPVCETNGLLGSEGAVEELLKAGNDTDGQSPTPVFKQ